MFTFQRKKETLEKNRLLQQTITNTDCLSPEPVHLNGRQELSKCLSANNLKTITTDTTLQTGPNHQKNYGLTKSQSGINVHTNGNNDKSSSSASAVSSPSTSQKEETER